MYFVAEQTKQRSGFQAPVAPGFAHGAYHIINVMAKKRTCRQSLKGDSVVSSGAVCGQKSPCMKMSAIFIISLKFFVNLSDRT